MFGILTTPLKLLFVAVALYGIAFIPIQGRPIWKHVEINSVRGWEGGRAFISDQTKAFKQSIKTWVKPTQKGKELRGNPPREEIRASEEKALEKILEENQKKTK